VIAAMGQSAAHLLKRDFHIRRCPFIHISHERSPITNRKNTREPRHNRHAAEITYVTK
jgi:hypothetical protein